MELQAYSSSVLPPFFAYGNSGLRDPVPIAVVMALHWTSHNCWAADRTDATYEEGDTLCHGGI